MNQTTHMTKGRDGWRAETAIPMEQVTDNDNWGRTGERRLTILTYKSTRGGLLTSATCSIHSADGIRSHALFGDFSLNVFVDRTARCTEKTVIHQHTKALELLDSILEQAKAFYADKEMAKAKREEQPSYADRVTATEKAHPCKYGHLDCSTRDGGACVDEVMGAKEARAA